MPNSIGGLASGLDTAQIINALMQGERAGRSRIEARHASYTRDLTAWQDVDGTLNSLQAAAKVFKTPGTFETGKATTTDDWLATVTAGTGAKPGSFSFSIESLATAHQTMAKNFAAPTDLTGAGKAFVGAGLVGAGLALADGSALPPGRHQVEVRSVSGGSAVISFDGFEQTVASNGAISLNDGNGNSATFSISTLKVGSAELLVTEATATTTLSQLASQINAFGAGVSATVIDDAVGANPVHFIVSARSTGTQNAVTVDFSGLAGFGGHPFGDLRAASNARLLLADGSTVVERPTNTVTDLLEGASIDLKMADPGVPVTLSVERDNATIVNATKTAIDAVNSVIGSLKRNSAYNEETRESQPLSGDSRVSRVRDSLRESMRYVDTGQTLQRLRQIGISVKSDGTYTFSETALRDALAADYAGTLRILAGDVTAGVTGVFPALATSVDALRSGEGVVAGALSSTRSSLATTAKSLSAEDVRLSMVEERIRKKYTQLEQTMASLSSQANGLARALGG